MRSAFFACLYSLAMALTLTGCGGGGNFEKELDALEVESKKVNDEKSFNAFMLKANGLSDRITSSKNEKQLQLKWRLDAMIMEAGKKANSKSGK